MQKKSGFTLIELMVTLAVLAILATIGIPAFSDLLKRHKAAGEIHQMLSLISLARSEAIKRSQVVTLCKSGSDGSCSGDWRDGWLLFVDGNKDGVRDEGEEILTGGQSGQGFQLSYRAFGSSNHLRFSPMGFTLAHNGTFKLCPEDNDSRFARAVVISKTARARLTLDSNGDGIYEHADGKPLTCP